MPSPTKRREVVPLVAVAGLVAWLVAPGTPLAVLPLLVCPGWGLTRTLSVIDRGFGVLAAALVGSWLVLAAVGLVGASTPDHLGLLVHLASLGLCLTGRLRLQRFRAWLAARPPHPAPMPWLPARAPACLAVLVLTALALAHAEPPGQVGAGGQRLAVADRALAFAPGAAPDWRALQAGDLMASAAATLSAASDSHPVVAAQWLALAAVLACLAAVAEGIARLWGNRGGTRAMLAFLLGLNPLSAWFLVSAAGEGPVSERMGSPFAPGITTALQPFVDGSAFALTLGCTALLLSATLSVVRRSSTHVPRLMTLAAFGLTLNDPSAAALLLPGWLVGLAWSALLCKGCADNDPHLGSTVRREGEPRWLRAPFWRPALHLLAGALPAVLLVGPPDLGLDLSGAATWSLLGAVGPGCLLFLPGIRHLNASPGREAYLLIGLVGGAVLSALSLAGPGLSPARSAALLATVLAVPAANGALKMTELYGHRARAVLVLLAATAALGPLAWLREVAERPRLATAISREQLVVHDLPPGLADALGRLDLVAPATARLVLDVELEPEREAATELMSRRVLLRPAAAAREAVRQGGLALARLRADPALGARELWLLSRDPQPPPGLERVGREGGWALLRQRAPDVVLVTVAALRDDRLDPAHMPALAARARSGLRLTTALTPMPLTGPGLASLLTGLSPVEHDLRDRGRRLGGDQPTLARAYAERGYRTAAVVALDDEQGLLAGFDAVHADPRMDAGTVVGRSLEALAVAQRPPLFLWVHLADLQPPYEVPADARTPDTGSQPFPETADLTAMAFGTASFPPLPSGRAAAGEVDLRRGLAQYEALVEVVDQALSRLLDSVPDQDLLVLTAPHGTSLLEHDAWFVHGPDLFEPSVRVPLVLAGAGLPVGEDRRLTALQDLSALLLEGRLPERERVHLESGWRPGLGTGRAYPPELDPGARGLSPRLWGERGPATKTLLTRPPGPEGRAAGVAFDLEADPQETQGLPADPYVLRRIDAWRRRGRPASLDDAP